MPLDLDLKAPANVRDPFPAYAFLREHEPVHRSQSLGAWVVTRYDDVLEVFAQPERFSSDRFRKAGAASERPAVQAVSAVLRHWLVFRDAPDHTRLRALLQKSFTPRQLEKCTPRIRALANELLAPIAARGASDFIRDFAFPLPALVIAELLGAPGADFESIKQWSDRLAAYLGGASDGRDIFAEAEGGLAKLVEYFRALLAEKRRRPGDDLMSLMLHAEIEGGRLSDDEVVANCVLLLFAGHETTTNLLGNGLYHLLAQPARLAALRAHPEWLPSATEELLRYDGPSPATLKISSQDFSWHGRSIRRGDFVLPMIASANRDPRQFPEPDRLDLERTPNRHLAFAYGIHFCLGAPLARLEARLAFEAILRRLPRLELPGWCRCRCAVARASRKRSAQRAEGERSHDSWTPRRGLLVVRVLGRSPSLPRMLRKIAIRGIEMELEDAGAGARPFVLVHGFTGSRDDFREHVPELAKLGRTIALDQRGHGGTTNSGRSEDYTLEGLVADLAAAFGALGLERADLLGHSLGGMVALRFALAHPKRVASLVLMDTSARPMKLPIPEPLRAALAALVREQGVAALLAGMRQVAAQNFPAAARRNVERMGAERFWERIQRKLDAMDPVAWEALARVLGDHAPVTDRLVEIRCPTLVLVGAEDVPFLAPADELARGIRGALRVTIEGAAHSPQLENPAEWAAAIRAHLARAR